MKIREIFLKGRPLLSFEFFPPKKVENEHILEETVGHLKKYSPDFVSITYGAGGSTRAKTLEWTLRLKDVHGLNVMMHLTCVGSTRSEIDSIVARLTQEGVDNILALRGDPPRESGSENPWKDFRYAFELVRHIKKKGDFCIGVAGYPEGHIESPSLEKDTEYLKMKVDEGADFIITQLFFDNSFYFRFRERAERAGITVPILPGIMPIINLGQVTRFTEMCGASVPQSLIREMEGLSPEDTLKKGVDFAIAQCEELIREGAPGIHFYTLNRNRATEMILEELGDFRGRESGPSNSPKEGEG